MKFTLKYSGDIYPEIPRASIQLILGWVRRRMLLFHPKQHHIPNPSPVEADQDHLLIGGDRICQKAKGG